MSEKFWILEPHKTRLAKWDSGNIWKKRDSAQEGYAGFGGPANRLLDLRVVPKTADIPDFVWTVPDCLIRTEALDMLHDQGFTGFQVRHVWARLDSSLVQDGSGADDAVVEVSSMASARVENVWELVVTGWGGLAGPGSGVTRVPNTEIWEGYPELVADSRLGRVGRHRLLHSLAISVRAFGIR